MNAKEEVRIKQLLKHSLPPVNSGAEPQRDLWPGVMRRLDDSAAGEVRARRLWVWLDAALLAGLVVLGASFPATIPLLLYYL